MSAESLTLHGPDGERLVGFDNTPAGSSAQATDDHDLRIPRRGESPGGFLEHGRLLSVLRERGIIT